jgi:hypothetical protein
LPVIFPCGDLHSRAASRPSRGGRSGGADDHQAFWKIGFNAAWEVAQGASKGAKTAPGAIPGGKAGEGSGAFGALVHSRLAGIGEQQRTDSGLRRASRCRPGR